MQPDSPANTPISPHGICAAGRNGKGEEQRETPETRRKMPEIRRGIPENTGNTQKNTGEQGKNIREIRMPEYRNAGMPEKEAGKCRKIDSNQISRSQYCG